MRSSSLKHTQKLIAELCNYLGEDFDKPMCQELWRHVRECDACRDYIESVRTTVEIIRNMQTPHKAPETVKTQILQMLRHKRSGQT